MIKLKKFNIKLKFNSDPVANSNSMLPAVAITIFHFLDLSLIKDHKLNFTAISLFSFNLEQTQIYISPWC